MIGKALELLGIVKTALATVTIPPQNFTLPNPFGALTFAQVVQKITDFLILIAAPLATIMVIVGGYYMVTAAGDSEKFSTGKKTIVYAVLGLAIILLADGVARIIQSIF